MKATIILRLTLGLNLLLAALVAFSRSGKPSVPLAEPLSQRPALTTTIPSQVTFTNVSMNVLGMNWSQVEAEDFPLLIANLRGAGCPEYVVRGLVIGRLEDLYRGKRSQYSDGPYLDPWAGLARRQEIDDATRATNWSQLNELSARVRELFGIDYDAESYHAWRNEGGIQIFFGFLSDEKSLNVMMTVGDGVIAGERIRQAAKGILIPDDLRHLTAIGNNLLAACQKRLEPAEFNELRLRAQGIFLMESGKRFKAVDLSGEDLRRISAVSFTFRDVVIDEFMNGGRDEFLTEEDTAQRQATFDQKLATLLNPVQWQEYQLSDNEDYQATVDFTRKNQLPRIAAEKVTRVFGDARDQAADIRKDKSLTEDEQRAALALLGATLKNNIRSTLGSHTDAFLEAHGGLLNELVPPTPPK